MKYPLEVNQKFDALRRSARKRGLIFNLRKKDVAALLEETVCAYSGEPFGEGQQECMTFERVNPHEGYIRGNILAVKKKYNDVRSDDLTVEQSQQRLETAQAKSLVQHKELRTMEDQQEADQKRLKKVELQVHQLKKSINNRKQNITNKQKQIKNTSGFIANMTVMIEGVQRHYDQNPKTIWQRIKEHFQ